MLRRPIPLALLLVTTSTVNAQRPALGPKDGHDLPHTDIDRIQVGDVAPDFTLEALSGPNVTLSDYRGKTIVVLVFYRGHW